MEALLMAAEGRGIESISVRRATLADADKVRYRVYSTATEFVAVIAESALMAVKVAGVAKPHKIVRDLPTEGIAIEAQRMSQLPSTDKVSLPLQRGLGSARRVAEMPMIKPGAAPSGFVAMPLADLRSPNGPRARILPPEFLSQIIEEHAKSAPVTPAPVAPELPPAAPEAPAFDAEPVTTPPADESELAEQIVNAPLPETMAESVMRLADEVLPPVAPRTEAPLAVAADPLGPDEVAKLLSNGGA